MSTMEQNHHPNYLRDFFVGKMEHCLLPRNFAQLKFYDGSNLRLQTENKIACFSNSIVKSFGHLYLRHSRRSECTSIRVLNTYFQSYYTLTQYGGTTASKQSKCFEERRIETGSYVIVLSENRESVEESVELLCKGVPSTFMAGLTKVGKVPGAFWGCYLLL